MISATISLLLSAPLTAQNILLNGLAIGFATVIDDLMAMFFLSVEQREAFSDWVFRRCYAVSLGVLLVLTVQNMRGLLPHLGNHDSQELPTGSSLCSDILEVAIYVPHVAGVVASWYYTFTRWRRDGGSYPLLIRHCLSRQVCLHCKCVLLFLVVMVVFQII